MTLGPTYVHLYTPSKAIGGEGFTLSQNFMCSLLGSLCHALQGRRKVWPHIPSLTSLGLWHQSSVYIAEGREGGTGESRPHEWFRSLHHIPCSPPPTHNPVACQLLWAAKTEEICKVLLCHLAPSVSFFIFFLKIFLNKHYEMDTRGCLQEQIHLFSNVDFGRPLVFA